MGSAKEAPCAPRELQTWSSERLDFTTLVPPKSKSFTGKKQESALSVLPLLRSQKYQDAYETSVTRGQQAALMRALKAPKHQGNVINKGQRGLGSLAEKGKTTGLTVRSLEENGFVALPQVPKKLIPKDVKAAQSRWKVHHQQDDTWSKYVRREWCTFTARRAFTWGGRLTLELPGFHPNNERFIREKHPPLRL